MNSDENMQDAEPHPLSAEDLVLLAVRNLSLGAGEGVPDELEVEGLSFTLQPGQTLCFVGETGAGKTAIAQALMRMLQAPNAILAGEICYRCASGETLDLTRLKAQGRVMRSLRGREIALIFRESLSAFSPVHTIGRQMVEAIRLQLGLNKREAHEKAISLLQRVDIPDPTAVIARYAFECSAGMRQRIMLAMALICQPRLLIADEPTSGMDLVAQAEILSLIRRLQMETGMALLFMTHDLSVAAEIADRIGILKAGRLLELGSADEIFASPQQDHTRALVDALSRLETSPRQAKGRTMGAKKLMEVLSLSKVFASRPVFLGGRNNAPCKALDKVSFDLYEGENLGLVGETGSGKTTLRDCLVRLQAPSSGELLYRLASGLVANLSVPDREELCAARQEIRLVFRDPTAAFSSHLTIEQVLKDALPPADRHDEQALYLRQCELLAMVGLPPQALEAYPHAFTASQLQRIAIARALATRPRLIIADQVTSMLEAAERAEILDLLLALQQQLGLSFILISADIREALYFCDRVAVIYRGQLVEQGSAAQIRSQPEHPYTKALIAAVPGAYPQARRIMNRLAG